MDPSVVVDAESLPWRDSPYHPPGSIHKPSSKAGCLLLVILPHPIEDLEGA